MNDPPQTEADGRPVLSDAEHALGARVDLYGSTQVRDMYDQLVSWRVRDSRDLQERDHHLTEMSTLAGKLRELLRAEVGTDQRGGLAGRWLDVRR